MVGFLHQGMEEAVWMGFRGFRDTGDLSWCAREMDTWCQMPEYESALYRYFPGKPWLGICYNRTLRIREKDIFGRYAVRARIDAKRSYESSGNRRFELGRPLNLLPAGRDLYATLHLAHFPLGGEAGDG
jgi:hypothetical protein